jgi:hypothetical protein
MPASSVNAAVRRSDRGRRACHGRRVSCWRRSTTELARHCVDVAETRTTRLGKQGIEGTAWAGHGAPVDWWRGKKGVGARQRPAGRLRAPPDGAGRSSLNLHLLRLEEEEGRGQRDTIGGETRPSKPQRTARRQRRSPEFAVAGVDPAYGRGGTSAPAVPKQARQ